MGNGNISSSDSTGSNDSGAVKAFVHMLWAWCPTACAVIDALPRDLRGKVLEELFLMFGSVATESHAMGRKG